MVKHFNQQGKIVSVNYRASLKKQVAKMWEQLSHEEIKQVKSIVSSNALPEVTPSAKVLDAVILYLDFTHYRTKEKLSEGEQKLLRSALIKRSSLPKAELSKVEYNQNNRPENAHAPERWSVFTRMENRKVLSGFEVKQGYHDLLSNDQGYDAFSQFDFLYGSAVYDYKDHRLSYDELTLVNLISMHEYKYYDPQLSWRALVAADRIYDLNCGLCHKFSMKAYGGMTFKLNDKNVLSFLAGIAGEASSHFKKGFRAGPGGELSLYSQLGNRYKIGIYDEIRFDATKKFSQDYYNQAGLRQSYFNGNQDDFRFESSVVSQYGSFKKNTIIHQVKYGHFF
jgi:hypothetical protein